MPLCPTPDQLNQNWNEDSDDGGDSDGGDGGGDSGSGDEGDNNRH